MTKQSASAAATAPAPAPVTITVITGSTATTQVVESEYPADVLSPRTKKAGQTASTAKRQLHIRNPGRIRLFRVVTLVNCATAVAMIAAGITTWDTAPVTPAQCYSLPTFGLCIALYMGLGAWLPNQRKSFLILAWMIGAVGWFIPMIVFTGVGFRPAYTTEVRATAADEFDADTDHSGVSGKYESSDKYADRCANNLFLLSCCAAVNAVCVACSVALGWVTYRVFVVYESDTRHMTVPAGGKGPEALVTTSNVSPEQRAALIARSKNATVAPQKWVWSSPVSDTTPGAGGDAWASFKRKPDTDKANGANGDGSVAVAVAGVPNNIAISSGAGVATLAAANGIKMSPPAAAPVAAAANGGLVVTDVTNSPVQTRATRRLADAANTSALGSRTPPARSTSLHPAGGKQKHKHTHRHHKSHKPKDASAAAATGAATKATAGEVPVTEFTRSARGRGERALGFTTGAEFDRPASAGAEDSGADSGCDSPSPDAPPTAMPGFAFAPPSHAPATAFSLDTKPPLLAAKSSGSHAHSKASNKHHTSKPPPAAAAAAGSSFQSVLPS